MLRVFAIGFLLGLAGSACLEAWPLGGPWKCGADQTCPTGWTCDDQLCCQPDSELGCPTIPTTNNGCRTGTAALYYEDRDGDGEGNDKVSRYLCRPPLSGGWVRNLGDCDDTSAATNHDSPEQCNGKDDNCNGDIDETLNRSTFFRDQDGDGWGQTDAGRAACIAPPGYVADAGDCAVFDPARHPGAQELCNNIDDDCDGNSDQVETAFADTDDGTTSRFPCQSAGFGVCGPGTFRCNTAVNPVVRTCVSNRMPAQFDRCDALDNDCDNQVDESPDCAGPPNLLGPNLTREARTAVSLTVTQQTTGCQKGNMTPTSGWNDATHVWTASTTGDNYHLWYVEAPGTTTWDLTRQSLKLRFAFNGGGTPASAFGNPGRFRNPVIYLCGDQGFEIIRYVPANSQALGDTGGIGNSIDSTFVLSSDPAWVVGRGSGFDTSKVRRIEVLISATGPFTVTIDPATGFVR
jgi:hypothetical protein